MRFLAALLALIISVPASAGGFGLLGTGGIRSEMVHYYDTADEHRQYSRAQILPVFGGGFEILLGDNDDAFTGVMRGFYLQDGALTHPAELTDPDSPPYPDDVEAKVRTEPNHLGVASVGLQWGIIGEPEDFMVTIQGGVGSGFLTNAHIEFLFAELGGGVSYEFARDLRVFGNVNYVFRYRKGDSHGAAAYAGVRYFFD